MSEPTPGTGEPKPAAPAPQAVPPQPTPPASGPFAPPTAAPTPPPAAGSPASTPPVSAAPASGAPASPPAAGVPGATAPAATAAPAKNLPAVPAPRPATPAKAKKASNGASAGAYLLGVFALVIAVVAAGGAAYAIKELRDMQQEAGQPNAVTSTTPAPEESSPAAEESPSEAAPSPSASSAPAVVYSPEFVRAEVLIPAPAGCNASYVDVDTLATGTQAGHEFYLSACVDPDAPELRIDRTSGRSSSGSNPTPQMCSSLIAGTPGTQELVLEVEEGLTFCLLTHRGDANTQNLPQRLAIVEVLTLTPAGSVRIAVSTYRLNG